MSGPRARHGLLSAIWPAWSGRNFTLVFAARACMSTGRALAGVLTPIYLALEGFSAFELSGYILVVAIFSALASSVVGLWSDRVGRRAFMVVVPLLTAAAGATFAFTASVPVLFVMGALGSFGRGAGAGAGAVGPYQPAESALVTEIVGDHDRNSAFGRLSFASSLGATVGGLAALLVRSGHLHGAAATGAFRPAFLVTAAASLAAGLVALGLDEPRAAPSPPVRGRAGDGGVRLSRGLVLPRRSRWLLYRLWATNTVNGMAVGMFGPFVAYWFFRRFGAGAGEIGALFAVINAVTMASTLSAAGLARRWGLVRTLSTVRAAQAVLLVPMALSPSFALAGAIYLVRMVVQRVGLPLRQSYAVGLADPAERASVAALSNLPSQLTMAGSPLLTGYLLDEADLALPFELAGAVQLVNAIMFWGFFHNHPPAEEAAGRALEAAPGAEAPGAEAPGTEAPVVGQALESGAG